MIYVCANKNSKETNTYYLFISLPVRCRRIKRKEISSVNPFLLVGSSHIRTNKEDGELWLLPNILDGVKIITYDEMLSYCNKEISWNDEPVIIF